MGTSIPDKHAILADEKAPALMETSMGHMENFDLKQQETTIPELMKTSMGQMEGYHLKQLETRTLELIVRHQVIQQIFHGCALTGCQILLRM